MNYRPLVWLVSAAFAVYLCRQLLTRRRRQILHENMRLIAKILLFVAAAALLWLGYRRMFEL